MKPKRRTRHRFQWRPPKSDWRSSPLSPNDVDTKQRWHRRYGRLGRRYETRTPEGPSVDEDYDSWDGDYRQLLLERTSAQGGPRGVLANRRIPTYNFRPPSEEADQETSPKDKILDVDVFLSRLSKPWPPSDGVESPSDVTPGTSESVVVEQEENRPRYTAAEKGKQRQGEPPSSNRTGPSAIKPAVPNNPQSTAPAMSTGGLRVPPRRHSPGDGNDDDGPSIEHVEDAASEYSAKIRSMVSPREPCLNVPRAIELWKLAWSVAGPQSCPLMDKAWFGTGPAYQHGPFRGASTLHQPRWREHGAKWEFQAPAPSQALFRWNERKANLESQILTHRNTRAWWPSPTGAWKSSRHIPPKT